jgi:hypothetical protein
MGAGPDLVQVDTDLMRAAADRLDAVEIGSIDSTPHGRDVFGFALLVGAVDRFVAVVDIELSLSRSGVEQLVEGLRLTASHYDDAHLTVLETIVQLAYWSRT